MDKRVTISGLPETPREFGFWMDGGWQGARTLYERISPAHGVPVTRIPVCTVGGTGFISPCVDHT